jgi:hypothetical protein
MDHLTDGISMRPQHARSCLDTSPAKELARARPV